VIPAVHRERSLQSRLTGLLAAALAALLVAGTLAWYYSSALARQAQAREAARERSAAPARGEMPLPPLRPSPLPMPQPEVATLQEPPAGLALPAASVATPVANLAPPGPPAKSAAQLAQERQLSGAAFERVSTSVAVATPPPEAAPGEGSTAPATAAAGASNNQGRQPDPLGVLLRPTVTPAVQAQVLPTQRFLLPKGAFIDCTLETAIDSSLPGFTSCVTASDTFGADGKVVLLERGTRLTGETRGQVAQGSARVFVLWTQARTPQGVVVPLDSPAADELGRSGLPGDVDRHFWDRFGAAVLVTVLDGGVQAAVQSQNRNGGTVIYNTGDAQGLITESLKGTIDIPPTVSKPNGARVQVLVARDLDFRPVYELRTHN